jgi:hypothetical protein
MSRSPQRLLPSSPERRPRGRQPRGRRRPRRARSPSRPRAGRTARARGSTSAGQHGAVYGHRRVPRLPGAGGRLVQDLVLRALRPRDHASAQVVPDVPAGCGLQARARQLHGRESARVRPTNIAFSPEFNDYTRTVAADGNVLKNGATYGQDMWFWGYKILNHETGHAISLPDSYNASGIGGTHRFVGGWDMMGNILGRAPELMAWNKWKLDWLKRPQVGCVTRGGVTEHRLTPIEIGGPPGRAKKLVVVRTGRYTAWVAELRRALGNDAATICDPGVLVYRLDASIPNGDGSIQVHDAKPMSGRQGTVHRARHRDARDRRRGTARLPRRRDRRGDRGDPGGRRRRGRARVQGSVGPRNPDGKGVGDLVADRLRRGSPPVRRLVELLDLDGHLPVDGASS